MTLQKERNSTKTQIEKKLLTPEESAAVVTNTAQVIDYKSVHQKIDVLNREQKWEARRKWDKLLKRLVVMGFFFSYVVIFLIGFGVLKFPDNAFAVPSVVAVGIVQTYGLAKLAVNYMFSEDNQNK